MSLTSTKLTLIYCFATYHALFMVNWILRYPGTGNFQNNHFNFEERVPQEFLAPIPEKLVSKYIGQTLVKLTHILPSAVWAGSIPIQFNPSIRKRFKFFHKCIGRIFAFMSILSMIGVCIIHAKGLSYENYLGDDGYQVVRMPFLNLSLSDSLLMGIALWFVMTIMKSITYARNRDYQNHQIWLIRHVGCGLWISLQRQIIGIPIKVYNAHYGSEPASGYLKASIFFYSAFFAILFSVALSEYTISLLLEKENKKNKTI